MLVAHDISLVDEIDALGPPKRKRGSPERTVQVTLHRYLKRVMPGAEVMAIKNEHAAKGATKRQRERFTLSRRAEGVRKGTPDLIVDPPDQPIFYVEVKAPKTGVISPDQDDLHGILRSHGRIVIVANSIETLRYGMQRAGIRTNETPGQLAIAPKIRVAKRRHVLPADPVPL